MTAFDKSSYLSDLLTCLSGNSPAELENSGLYGGTVFPLIKLNVGYQCVPLMKDYGGCSFNLVVLPLKDVR